MPYHILLFQKLLCRHTRIRIGASYNVVMEFFDIARDGDEHLFLIFHLSLSVLLKKKNIYIYIYIY